MLPLLTSSSMASNSLESASLSSYKLTNSLRRSTGIGTEIEGPRLYLLTITAAKTAISEMKIHGKIWIADQKGR